VSPALSIENALTEPAQSNQNIRLYRWLQVREQLDLALKYFTGSANCFFFGGKEVEKYIDRSMKSEIIFIVY
jgi:hypothetical protein